MATLCHRGWRPAGTISDLQSATAILFFAVASALLKCGGQLGSTNHSGRTAMDTSFRRGWLASNVWGVAMLLFVKWCILKQFLLCEALGDLTVSIGQFHYQILTFFCSVHVRLLHCKMRIYIICFVAASFALWFCDCAILLSIPLTDDDIKIQRRHIKLGNKELKRQLATNDR